MDKVFFEGAHRCLDPGRTLARIGPLLAGYGITRLANVTGLDALGVPVVMAVRPGAATVCVSQGKGVTPAAAAVSAAMEAIELHHAEFAVPAAVCRAPAASLGLGYGLADVAGEPGCLAGDRTILDWVQARTISGAPALAPRDLVRMGPQDRAGWSCLASSASTNGLAAGNTRDEAIAHALHELIERDALAAVAAAPGLRLPAVDPAGAGGYCAEMAGRIAAGGARLRVAILPSRFAVPVFAAWLQAEDAPWTASGSGAHSDPRVALSRAITEACQSRLTIISGARDDLPPFLYRGLPDAAPPLDPGDPAPWPDVVAGLGWERPTDEAEKTEAARRISSVTGREPIVVDLAAHPCLSVVKVFAPRTRLAATVQPPPPRAEP